MFDESKSDDETIKFNQVDSAVAKFASTQISGVRTREGQPTNLEKVNNMAVFAQEFLGKHGIDPNSAVSSDVFVMDDNWDPTLNVNLSDEAGLINSANKKVGGVDHSVSFTPPKTGLDGKESTSVGVQFIKTDKDEPENSRYLSTHMWLEGSEAKPNLLKVECEDVLNHTSLQLRIDSDGNASIGLGAVTSNADADLRNQIDLAYEKDYEGKQLSQNYVYEKGNSGIDLETKQKVRLFMLDFFEKRWNLTPGQLSQKVDIGKTFDNALNGKITNPKQMGGIAMTELAFQ